MKLYTCSAGPYPRRILCYLAMKAIDGIELQEINIHDRAAMCRPEFLTISPAGSVPALLTDEGVSISQSTAIMEYLEEVYPDPPMYGRNEAERRRIDTQSQLINDVMAYRKMSVATTMPYLLPYQTIRAPEASLVCNALEWSRFEQMSIIMNRRTFLASDEPTIADIMLYTMLEYLRAVYDRFMPPHLHNLAEWYQRFRTLSPLEPYKLSGGYITSMSGGIVKERP
jgi:glutathione S-transferase